MFPKTETLVTLAFIGIVCVRRNPVITWIGEHAVSTQHVSNAVSFAVCLWWGGNGRVVLNKVASFLSSSLIHETQ
jgi:hypothetical protein